MKSAPFALAALLLLLTALTVTAMPVQANELPSIAALESKRDDLQQQDPVNEQALQEIRQALSFRQEVDSNLARIKELEQEAARSPASIAKLGREIDDSEAQLNRDWQSHYHSLELEQLVARLIEQLDTLEQNQTELAQTNTVLTRAQTLPEHAQTSISNALSRMDEIRLALSRDTDSLPEAEQQRLISENRALETRIDLRNQELAVSDTLQDKARLQQRLLLRQEQIIQKKLDTLQQLINERRTNQLLLEDDRGSDRFSAEVLSNNLIRQELQRNQKLRERLNSISSEVNELMRQAIDTKTQLDRTRALESTIHDQIRLLDSSLLLSRVLYEQQKSLPKVEVDKELGKRISDARLEQFENNQARQRLSAGTLPSGRSERPLSEEVRQAFAQIRQERLELYSQLDRELARQLSLQVRTQLNQQQLSDIARSLDNTISEQTFWMPSTQPLGLSWLFSLPGQLLNQVISIPWLSLAEQFFTTLRHYWAWLLVCLIPTLVLLWQRRNLKARITTLNSEVGYLRKDSQGHTPLAMFYSMLLAAPGPAFLGVLAAGLWLQEGSLAAVLAATTAKLALLWLVFEFIYRLLGKDGVAQRHFRWDLEQNKIMRRRLMITGLLLAPMALIIAFGEQWPALLSNDRLGLVIMVASLLVVSASLPRAANAYPGRNTSAALRRLAVAASLLIPLILVVLILAGYYYTTVRLSGRMIDSLYLLMLWILLDATAVRGLAVVAQRMAYQRAVAQREAEPKAPSGEAVEVEEPKLDLQQINQQSLRLIRLAIFAGVAVLFYWVWADIMQAFAYTDNIVLWDTAGIDGADPLTTDAISLGDLMTALLIGIVTFLLANNLPGLLEVLVLSKLDLKQGTSYATTTLLSYFIVSTGLILILGTMGVSWDKLQWLVAALGVGLGFGLQEIFANFVSGLIILFEKPIRIGDVITIDNLDGTVSNIRIRATTIIDFDRKEIIVPNKVFVTERLINWSLSDTVTRIVLKVGFAYGSDLKKCRDILLQAARENPLVLKEPAPQVFFISFGASTLDHELRVHVHDIGDRLPTTNSLNSRIDELCREQDVEIAFSQLDVHLYTEKGDELHIQEPKQEKGDDKD